MTLRGIIAKISVIGHIFLILKAEALTIYTKRATKTGLQESKSSHDRQIADSFHRKPA
jgi:hypothetical protein